MSPARIELHSLGPARPWVGQLVPIDVSVWRPQGDTPLEPFSLDDVIAASAIVKWSTQDPPPDERQEGDTRFLVQRRTLLVFPQAEGEITVPPIVARYTEPSSKAMLGVKSPKLSFQAAIPVGAGDSLPLVASAVKLEQSFDRDLSRLEVGDGFTRTVTLSATDTDAIAFPELSLPAVSGLTAYPGGVRAESTTERGQIAAKQTHSITYVVDRVGPHEMPGLALRWLEPQSGRYSEATIQGQTLWTRPNWALGLFCMGTAKEVALLSGAALLVTLAILTMFVVRRVRRGPGAMERALSRHFEEWRAFREVLRAARSNQALRLLESLYAWLVIQSRARFDRSLRVFRNATPAARNLTAAAETALFRDGQSQIDMRGVATICHRARRAIVRPLGRSGRAGLNPADGERGTS